MTSLKTIVGTDVDKAVFEAVLVLMVGLEVITARAGLIAVVAAETDSIQVPTWPKP